MENETLVPPLAKTATHSKNEIGLPLIALGLVIVPVLAFLFLVTLLKLYVLLEFMFLFMALSAVAGMITGILSLIRGKGNIGLAGNILAVTAILLPVIFIIFPVLFLSIGVATGVISGM
jgi:hypothetical protein